MRLADARQIFTPDGEVHEIVHEGAVMWSRITASYVSLGDSIAAGHAINSDWEADYGTGSQYGNNGNASTVIVPGSYTSLIRDKLIADHGANHVEATSFAQSGDTTADLIDKLSHQGVREAISQATLVTICIGANDILGPALNSLEGYIARGNPALVELAAQVEANLAVLADDSDPGSYTALLECLYEINPNARYVFMDVYNPLKYLWIEEGKDGFFSPILNVIPEMTILGWEVDEYIKDYLLGTDIVETLFDRVNGLGDWAEVYISQLNAVLREKVAAFGKGSFEAAGAKLLFESFPDRPVTATKHYNDLVSIEYTRGYDTAKMDWGRLYEEKGVAGYWSGLVNDNLSISTSSISGLDDLAAELVEDIAVKVVVPDVDPHPETYGHQVLYRLFADALGWQSLVRYNVSYQANGGSGSMSSQEVVGVGDIPAFTILKANAFTPVTGYYFTGWSGGYSAGQAVGLFADLALAAQWSNIYSIIYKHTNHTNLYGDDETGHKECYALYIDGELKPKFGTFAESSPITYQMPYGTTVRVVVSNYNPTELTYDDVNCDVYWNGTSVSKGYRGTEYTFALASNVTVDFRWKIAGSLATFDMQSWEDCYITTW